MLCLVSMCIKYEGSLSIFQGECKPERFDDSEARCVSMGFNVCYRTPVASSSNLQVTTLARYLILFLVDSLCSHV